MKSFFAVLFVSLVLYQLASSHSSEPEDRRLRNGNGFQRRIKICRGIRCGLIKGIKNRIHRDESNFCYRLPSHDNVTVSECVYNCLKSKGEQLDNVVKCVCSNGKCIEDETTTTQASTTIPTSNTTSTQPPSTSTSTQTSTSTSTTNVPSTSSQATTTTTTARTPTNK